MEGILRFLVRVSESLRGALKGAATEELVIAGDALVTGGRNGLFTSMDLRLEKKAEASC
jgi:hypothetical protein